MAVAGPIEGDIPPIEGDIPPDGDTTDPDEEDGNSTTVRAPVPIGAVVVSIAVMLYMAYRGVEGD